MYANPVFCHTHPPSTVPLAAALRFCILFHFMPAYLNRPGSVDPQTSALLHGQLFKQLAITLGESDGISVCQLGFTSSLILTLLSCQ